jgi:membrane protease YdiL (CAAX protease family)
MIAVRTPALPRPHPADGPAWLQAALLAGGLGALVWARAEGAGHGLDQLTVGAAFVSGLLLLAVVAGVARPSRRSIARPVAVGAVVGLAIVGAGLAGPALGGIPVIGGLGRPAAAFGPWVAVTIGVAVAEEAILRGALFDRVQRAGGAPLAIVVTTVAFALLHVPLYGWHVVPLDLAVGLALGGLRLATGGFIAPAVAHALADLATWWL